MPVQRCTCPASLNFSSMVLAAARLAEICRSASPYWRIPRRAIRYGNRSGRGLCIRSAELSWFWRPPVSLAYRRAVRAERPTLIYNAAAAVAEPQLELQNVRGQCLEGFPESPGGDRFHLDDGHSRRRPFAGSLSASSKRKSSLPVAESASICSSHRLCSRRRNHWTIRRYSSRGKPSIAASISSTRLTPEVYHRLARDFVYARAGVARYSSVAGVRSPITRADRALDDVRVGDDPYEGSALRTAVACAFGGRVARSQAASRLMGSNPSPPSGARLPDCRFGA